MLPMGQGALLLECSSLAEVMTLHTRLRDYAASNESAGHGVQEVVAAARTVLVRCDSPVALDLLKQHLLNAKMPEQAPVMGTLRILETVYDGADLQDVARLTGVSPQALLAWHSEQDWVAAFGGFAPGFMYLTPTGRALAVPRRATPRTTVPAGSVAVASEFSAVYPRATPGGWQLLGHCANQLWDAGRAVPALIQPGDTVRFSPVRELIALTATELSAAPVPAAAPAQLAHATGPPRAGHGLNILAAGILTTVQDLGRPGFAHVGVTGSGALDRAALRRANRMVGNNTSPASATDPYNAASPASATRTAGAVRVTGEAGAAGLETVLAGLRLKAAGTHVVAVTGGPVILLLEDTAGDERPVPRDTPFVLRDGETLSLLPAPRPEGFRSYLAVRGGLGAEQVLGSRATDLLSGLGPAPLQAGTFLPVLPAPSGSIVGFPEPPPLLPQDGTVLRYLPGPRQNWFTAQALELFESEEWSVGAQSNRIGLRLVGTPLARAETNFQNQSAAPLAADGSLVPAAAPELPSEGMVKGALQVPHSGLPVLFLADHPVTGGYPVLVVVLTEDLDMAAQVAPGATVRFRSVNQPDSFPFRPRRK